MSWNFESELLPLKVWTDSVSSWPTEWTKELEDCSESGDSSEGAKLFRKSYELSRELEIQKSCTIVLNSRKIWWVGFRSTISASNGILIAFRSLAQRSRWYLEGLWRRSRSRRFRQTDQRWTQEDQFSRQIRRSQIYRYTSWRSWRGVGCSLNVSSRLSFVPHLSLFIVFITAVFVLSLSSFVYHLSFLVA